MSLNTYHSSLKEDYYSMLAIDPVPNEEEVVGLYPAIDTAIVKCTKVIQKHSMPSSQRSLQKKEEHNQWIDETWTLIGVANYYRRDYEKALKSFYFVTRFFPSDPSNHIGELWMAKTYLQTDKLLDAKTSLGNIEDALHRQKMDEEKNKQSKSKKKPTSSAKPPPEVPESMLAEFAKTKAEYAVRIKENKTAIKELLKAVELTKQSSQKARLHYILGQMYETENKKDSAKIQYGLSLKYNAPYEMHFNARLKRAFMGGDEKVKKELLKMLRDAKNAQFKDQIYYALADIELQENDKDQAIAYLHKSAFFSTTNTRQKGMSYERLGDMAFNDRNYVSAQKYYDSCANVISETYPNYKGIKNKAEKLEALVIAVETAHFEDSVQRIAAMDESDREAFLKDVIKKELAAREARKKQEAERLRELQQTQNMFVQTTDNASKWYFNNAKLRGDGYDEFRKQWGTRDNEDNWRRSEKDFVLNKENDSTGAVVSSTGNPKEAKGDSLTVDMLLSNVPLTDSALALSNERLLEALYTAGIIYNQELNEPKMAVKQFDAVLDKNIRCKTDLAASYQLYKVAETINTARSEEAKNHILTKYPDSDYANFIRDPDFFIKRKEKEAQDSKDYLALLDQYNKGYYGHVVDKANAVINGDLKHKYRAKYMLLKAMCLGQTSPDKKTLLPVLEQLIQEFPNTDEEKRAKEMISIINNGYSVNEVVDFSKKSIFTYNDQVAHWVLVFLDKKDNLNTAKTAVSDFNKNKFSKAKLKVSTKVYGTDQNVILIQEFTSEFTAADYLRALKKPKAISLDFNRVKAYSITPDNMKLLIEGQKLTEYEAFYKDYY
jgi:tetratricopeptide (TPR) repeat protein